MHNIPRQNHCSITKQNLLSIRNYIIIRTTKHTQYTFTIFKQAKLTIYLSNYSACRVCGGREFGGEVSVYHNKPTSSRPHCLHNNSWLQGAKALPSLFKPRHWLFTIDEKANSQRARALTNVGLLLLLMLSSLTSEFVQWDLGFGFAWIINCILGKSRVDRVSELKKLLDSKIAFFFYYSKLNVYDVCFQLHLYDELAKHHWSMVVVIKVCTYTHYNCSNRFKIWLIKYKMKIKTATIVLLIRFLTQGHQLSTLSKYCDNLIISKQECFNLSRNPLALSFFFTCACYKKLSAHLLICTRHCTRSHLADTFTDSPGCDMCVCVCVWVCDKRKWENSNQEIR